jgi:hypothetical protein
VQAHAIVVSGVDVESVRDALARKMRQQLGRPRRLRHALRRRLQATARCAKYQEQVLGEAPVSAGSSARSTADWIFSPLPACASSSAGVWPSGWHTMQPTCTSGLR